MSSTARERVLTIEHTVERIRRERVPDARSGVFEIRVTPQDAGFALTGHTTENEAVEALLVAAAALLGDGTPLYDEVVRLPHAELGTEWHAVSRAAITPVYARPELPSPQISQLVLGMRVDVLERREQWLRIRSEDNYLGWVHSGYLEIGGEDRAHAWERGADGEPVVSLGADIVDADGRALARAPWGARLIRRSPVEFDLPDGSRGRVGAGEVVDVDRLADRFPPRGESIARTARRWIGVPYLWGGLTHGGVDCSGFTQAVFWMHGIALPRDSDMQARVGAAVDAGGEFAGLKPGDLLYFAEAGSRITHVAISLGGAEIVHSAISNGGVGINVLTADGAFDERLRRLFTHARRLLAD